MPLADSAAGDPASCSAATAEGGGGSFDEALDALLAAFAGFGSAFAAFAALGAGLGGFDVPVTDEEPAACFEALCPTALPLAFVERPEPLVEVPDGDEVTRVFGALPTGAGAGLGPVATGAGGTAAAGCGCGEPWSLGWFATEPGGTGAAAIWREPAT